MKNSVITGFSFLLGMGIGAYVTYMYVKDMYAEIAQEEINSVKEAYAEKEKNLKRDDIRDIFTAMGYNPKFSDEQENFKLLVNIKLNISLIQLPLPI